MAVVRVARHLQQIAGIILSRYCLVVGNYSLATMLYIGLITGALDLLVKCHVEMDHWYYRQETDDRLARVLAMEVDEDDQFAQLQEEDQVEELSLEVMQLLAFDSQAKHAIIAAGE